MSERGRSNKNVFKYGALAMALIATADTFVDDGHSMAMSLVALVFAVLSLGER